MDEINVEKFDWKDTIKINLLVLRSVGLWPKGNDFYKLNLYTIYAVVNGIILILLYNLSQLINIFFVYSDLEALTKIIFVAITNLLASTKMYFFVRNLRLIKQFFITLNNYPFRPKSLEQIHLVLPILKNYQTVHFSYVSLVCVVITTWSITPILNNGFKDFELPFPAWFPFNVEKFPNYQFAYLYQLICIWPISIANINLDFHIFAVMMLIQVQCELLCDNLRKLKDNTLYYKNLVECMEHHKGIIRLAQDINNFFSIIALGQMGTSVAVLALTMFQLSITGPFNGDGLGHILYITGITGQILLYCWFGNKVELKSNKILYALYESEWFNQPLEVKKSFLIFCIRCQKPIRMTAINLFALSLEIFIKIIRSAWSYFAVLYNVNNR